MSTRVDQTEQNGRAIFTLVDAASGASASIIPSYGFNLFDLRLPAQGEIRRVIVAAEDFAANPGRPGRNGIPILFPFPNRIRDGRYSFEGRDYELFIEPGKLHAIHGFAIAASWDVVEFGATDDLGAFLVGRFQISKNAPDRLTSWPADAILTVRYALAGRRLDMTITVANPTDVNLPHGFGIHPYFRLPFVAGTPDAGRLILPAEAMWVLEASLPTGEQVPIEPRVDFRGGGSTAGRQLDDVLTGLTFDEGRCLCRLVDDDLRCETTMGFDSNFRDLVVFVPPHDNTLVAVEPYTQTTDAINLAARGIDGGLQILKPGAVTTMRITIETTG